MALTSLIPADPDAPQVSQMQGGLPQLSTPLMPLVGLNQRGQQEQGLQNRISSYENPNKPQGFWQNVRHIAATIGNVAGDVVAPSTMALIPGTQLHNQIQHGQNVRELAGLQGEDREDETQARAAAAAPGENALRTAQTDNLTSETNARDNPTPVEPSLAQAYAHAVQSAIKNGQDPDKDPIVQHMRDAITDLNKQPAAKGTEHINVMGPDGKTPMIANYNPETGVTTDSTGKTIATPVPYEKPQITNNNAADNHLFAEQERGRGLLDAAEKQYRTAQQGANTMRDMLTSADAGNKMSGQMLPLEGALAITTAQGVHRINRTEVDQFAGGGSLYDKIAGEMGKVTAGQPMDAELRNDVRKLTDMQEKAAYQNYKDAHASATRRYKLEGEQPLPEPGASSGAGAPPPGAKVRDYTHLGGGK